MSDSRLPMKGVRAFFGFARLRESARICKDRGDPQPWTSDQVLGQYRFCNVFREDDRTTRWFRENVRSLLMGHSRVLIATVAFRWFNLISTGELLRPMLLEDGWNRKFAEKVLRGKSPLLTGAFMVKSPNGKDKLTGLCDCIENVAADADRLALLIRKLRSLRSAHNALRMYPFLGPFMAYEIVTDLRHTYLLKDAPDIDSWASAGPGCVRGLKWVSEAHGPIVRGGLSVTFNYNSKSDQETMLAMMRKLLEHSRDESLWPWPERQWSMREVEHTLCEFDKYRRAQQGQALKRRYTQA